MLKNSGYGYSDYGMFNSIWTCIGPKSYKHLDNSVLFTVRESLAVYVRSCVCVARAYARVYL
jgi:hypothetical protein